MKIHVKLLILLFALWAPAAYAESKMPKKTIDNLNEALADEANASHRYALFAKKADEEGDKDAAKLFRALSRSEAIHQRNHEKALRSLGLEPKSVDIKDVKVHSTSENLKEPVKDEDKESTKTYPEMVKEARSEHAPEATRSFTYAMNAEGQHAKLLEEARANLGKQTHVSYYVGKVSGATTTQPNGREPFTKIE